MKRRARAPLPLVTLAVAAAIVSVYGVECARDGQAICQRFGFVAADPSFETAVSSLFLHDPGSWAHILGNLAVLVLIGSRVEQSIGSMRFAALFVAGGLAGCGLHLVVDPSSTVALVGCSGSLFALLAVAAAVYGPAMFVFVGVLVGVLVVALARLRGVELYRRARRADAFAML